MFPWDSMLGTERNLPYFGADVSPFVDRRGRNAAKINLRDARGVRRAKYRTHIMQAAHVVEYGNKLFHLPILIKNRPFSQRGGMLLN